jgi:hypothetical protein
MKYACFIAIASLLVLTAFLLIHNGDSLPNWIQLTETNIIASTEANATTNENIQIGQVLFSFTKVILVLIVVILIIRNFIQIIKSVKSQNTFREQNIRNFQQVGLYFLVIFFINIFNIEYANNAATISLAFTPEYLLYAITAYILAEVFKEGNKLSEDNKLTI